MKKITGFVSLCLVIVILVSLLSACGAEKRFAGTWVEIDANGNPTGETLVLANDGTGSLESDGISGSVNWSVDKNKVFITISLCGVTETSEFTYKFSGNTLILTDTDGNQSTYRKNG